MNPIKKITSRLILILRWRFLFARMLFERGKGLFPNLISNLTFAGDGFATSRHVEFLQDKKFMESFDGAILGLPKYDRANISEIIWRAHICTWAASHALGLLSNDKHSNAGEQVAVDFVECGVWHGVLSKTICDYLDFGNFKESKFYLVDTWGQMLGSHASPNYQDDIFESVSARFSNHKNVNLIRGVIPEILIHVNSNRIGYLSIDLNDHEAERSVLEYFYDKMIIGGVIYFDDYSGFPKTRKMINDFFRDKPENLLHFPSGQSIVLKV